MELLAYNGQDNARPVFSVSVSINDLHRNARNYRIDSLTPENMSQFAMRITLFSSLEFSSVTITTTRMCTTFGRHCRKTIKFIHYIQRIAEKFHARC